MGIRFACSACNHILAVKTNLAGKRGLCPNCNIKLTVPEESQISDAEYKLLKGSNHSKEKGTQQPPSASTPKVLTPSNTVSPSNTGVQSKPGIPSNTGAAKKTAAVSKHGPTRPNAGTISDSKSATSKPTTVAAAKIGAVLAKTSKQVRRPGEQSTAPTSDQKPVPTIGPTMELPVEFVEVETSIIEAAAVETVITSETPRDSPMTGSRTHQVPTVDSTKQSTSTSVPSNPSSSVIKPENRLPEQFASAPVMIEPFEVEMDEPPKRPVVTRAAKSSSGSVSSSAPVAGGSQRQSMNDSNGSGSSGNVLDDDKLWYVRPPSGGEFGPASTNLLRKWMREGRVGSRAHVWQEGWPEWRVAGEVLPEYSKSDVAVAANSGVLVAGVQTQAGVANASGEFTESAAIRAKINRKKRKQATVWVAAMIVGMLVLIGLIVMMIIVTNQA